MLLIVVFPQEASHDRYHTLLARALLAGRIDHSKHPAKQEDSAHHESRRARPLGRHATECRAEHQPSSTDGFLVRRCCHRTLHLRLNCQMQIFAAHTPRWAAFRYSSFCCGFSRAMASRPIPSPVILITSLSILPSSFWAAL